MPAWLRGCVLLLCVVATGCIIGFEHPLGPADQSFIDARLLGSWVCTSQDNPDPVKLVFIDFDGAQYYLRAEEHEADAEDLRVLATRLEDSTFLSVRTLAPRAEREWTILQYSVTEPDHLTLRYVDPQPFADLLSVPRAVREALAARLGDPEVMGDLLSCARPDETRPEAGPEPIAGDEALHRPTTQSTARTLTFATVLVSS